MTHTNVQIPTAAEVRERQAFKMLQAERDFWMKEAEAAHNELRNIADAVERYGYVTVEIDGETTKLGRTYDPTEVHVPISEQHAVEMMQAGRQWLEANAPERMKDDETERFRAALTAIADGEGDADVIARQTLDGLDRE